jgi:hypothetical protein
MSPPSSNVSSPNMTANTAIMPYTSTPIPHTSPGVLFNLLALELFFLILAHPVYKM